MPPLLSNAIWTAILFAVNKRSMRKSIDVWQFLISIGICAAVVDDVVVDGCNICDQTAVTWCNAFLFFVYTWNWCVI